LRAEALETLTGLAHKRFGRIRAERIAAHLLELMPDADWPILRAGLDALVRRYSFARRDGLALVTKPKRGELLGTFRTRASAAGRRSVRPYDTEISSASPLRLSCSCPDYLRSSLALCKHGLVVLEALEVSGALTRLGSTPLSAASQARLTWQAYQPIVGSTDRLERLALQSGRMRRALDGFQDGRPLAAALRSPERCLTRRNASRTGRPSRPCM
jgi:hypothetical protein